MPSDGERQSSAEISAGVRQFKRRDGFQIDSKAAKTFKNAYLFAMILAAIFPHPL